MKYDLSILIPARSEMFLARTVEELLKNIRGNTEILVGLDGEWADPPVKDHERVTVVYFGTSQGQRAATNRLCEMSRAKYIMKIDAHCTVDEGFDVKMMSEMQDNYTMIPTLYNLYGFDWVCPDGHKRYQGPSGPCKDCGKPTTRDIIWKPRMSRKSEFYRFDTTLHFQYHGARKKDVLKDDVLVDTMSAQGSCFMLTRAKYWELNICDEAHGSWGQQGTEIACKTWLSGGRLVTNRKTWYSHLFRTQGGDFSFPYPQSGKQVDKAREYSRKLFLDNTWDKQIYPLSWLIEKFRPLPDWHDPKGKEMLDKVNEAGRKFNTIDNPDLFVYEEKTKKCNHIPEGFEHFPCIKCNPKEVDAMFKPSKGIIYYTDNKVNMRLGHKCRKQILKAGLPIVSVSHKPMDFGENYVYKGPSGYLAYHEQILLALEKSTADIVYFCEHDVLYDRSHFDFTPPKKDVYYYDFNFWRVRASDRFAIHYDTHQVNLICAYRELLLSHYREKVKRIKESGFNMRMGFEPGCNRRKEKIDDFKAEAYFADKPSLDIRHETNLTRSRWSKSEFRDQSSCQGWKEVKDIKEVSNLF